jgi:hypothetical protein
MAGLGDLHLIARPLVAIIGGVRVGGILHHVAAGLFLYADLVFVNLALFIKNTLNRFVGVFAIMRRIVCEKLYQITLLSGYKSNNDNCL